MARTKKNESQGPMQSAGLVQYFDISGGGIEVTPQMVLAFVGLFIAVELAISFLV